MVIIDEIFSEDFNRALIGSMRINLGPVLEGAIIANVKLLDLKYQIRHNLLSKIN